MLKYKINDKTNLRVSYFKSLARPNYYELVPYVIPSQTTSTSQRPDDNMDVIEVEEVHNPICQQHCAVIKAALKKHFSYAYSNGQIQWPKPFTSYQKQHMPLIKVSNYFLILIL